jgi:hypothetical protein
MIIIYDIDNFPQEMKKKITLYKHFKKYFLNQELKPQNYDNTDDEFLKHDQI